MSRVLPMVAAVLLAASCTFDCNATSCANGCCDQGACFEGNLERGGVQCGSTVRDAGPLCGTSGAQCNASLGLYCCPTTSGSYGLYCHNEECTSCYQRGSDCTPRYSTCCPGLHCVVKSGFSSSYECQ